MPLRYLFIDMNSYFASVEQQLRPELRNRPVAVVPVPAETTCCIAASYEAKRFGVKTGTVVREARRLCPDLRIVQARPELYITMHRRIVQAVESCLHVEQVLSVDEMACKLIGAEQRPEQAVPLAERIKAVLRREVGGYLRCSIGLGPNGLLAKVAADMQKPDGLTMIRSEDLPHRLDELQLTDLPGVGSRMQRRLHRSGITTVRQLCQLSEHLLARIWGSKVHGKLWWHRLRGDDLPETPTHRRSVGHSHVLPPHQRNDEGAKAVLTCLVHKAAARLRAIGYWAGSITLSVSFLGAPSWHERRLLGLCRDTLSLVRVTGALWEHKPPGTPLKVGIVLGDLVNDRSASPPLFEESRQLLSLSAAMDRLNRQFGAHTVYFGGMHAAQTAAPTRIAFGVVPDLSFSMRKRHS
jgi:DNA polymerase-4